jgi:hypothetical protein
MTTKIFEELPSRNNRPSPAGGQGPTDMKAKMEKKVRQAVYDIRYRARREDVDIKQAYSQYMQNSSLNGQERNMVKAKIFGTGMREDYNIGEFASSSVANALFKVFVEGVEEEPTLGEEYLQELRNGSDRKYKVRVTDKNGTSYVRYATRDKISDLRANSNIESVEMTEYGQPYEGERTKGDRTAAAKAGKDYDGDGKVESGAKEYRGSVHNAIQRKKGGTPDGKDTSSVKEDLDFFEEDKKKDKKDKKFDVMRGKGNTGRVKLFPETSKVNEEVVSETAVSTAQQKFMGMVHSYKKGEMKNASSEVKKAAKEMSDTEAKKFASTKHKGLPKHVQKEETACDSSVPQRDTRGDYAKTNVIKNKLRSGLGVKNPIVMVSNEEDVKEGMGLSVGISKLAGQLNANPRTSAEKGAKDFQKNVADPIGKVVKGAARAVVQPANMSPEAQKARKDKYRPEEVEFEGEFVDEARVDDGLSPEEKKNKRKERSGGQSDFTRQNLNRAGRGKSPKGMKPTKTTAAMTSVRKYEMALNQPETEVGKRVAGEIAMDKAERGLSGRRGS